MTSTPSELPAKFLSSRWGQGAVSVCLCLFGLSLALWFLPASPMCLVRADLLQGMGHSESALAVYDEVSEQGLLPRTRIKALRRSAMLWSLEKNDRAKARSRWEKLALLTPVITEQVEAWGNVADLYAMEAIQPVKAAEAYERAGHLSENDAAAASYLLAAGSQWFAAGQWKRADEVWLEVVEGYPSARSEAYIALGQMSMTQGEAEQALSWFENAEDTADGEEEHGLATLGVAMSLERLGILEEAIAEMNGADIPENVRDVRQRKMEARSEQLSTQ